MDHKVQSTETLEYKVRNIIQTGKKKSCRSPRNPHGCLSARLASRRIPTNVRQRPIPNVQLHDAVITPAATDPELQAPLPASLRALDTFHHAPFPEILTTDVPTMQDLLHKLLDPHRGRGQIFLEVEHAPLPPSPWAERGVLRLDQVDEGMVRWEEVPEVARFARIALTGRVEWDDQGRAGSGDHGPDREGPSWR